MLTAWPPHSSRPGGAFVGAAPHRSRAGPVGPARIPHHHLSMRLTDDYCAATVNSASAVWLERTSRAVTRQVPLWAL